MLEGEAYRTECQPSYDDIPDPTDYQFKPVDDCCICEEPFERGYTCNVCGRPVCPNCVCRNADDPKQYICPECPGACINTFF